MLIIKTITYIHKKIYIHVKAIILTIKTIIYTYKIDIYNLKSLSPIMKTPIFI